MGEQDHYSVLGVARGASGAEIKRRYRALMREAHPDANAGDPQATRKAARINRAFETLGHAERRREYDASLSRANGHAAAAGGSARTRGDERKYAAWAEEPHWEDIVAAHVPPKRPAHVHAPDPVI